MRKKPVVGDRVTWKDASGNRHTGYIAEIIPAGSRIPEWYIHKAESLQAPRFRPQQMVAARDRYLVDCGMRSFEIVESGVRRTVRDVDYRMVSVNSSSLVVID